MMSADVKANIKQQEIIDLVAVMCPLVAVKFPQNLKYNVKRRYIFHLMFVGILFIKILSV